MLEPQDDVPQFQPLTVLLRNICRDYPAGGGILRELLQNADDAGASSVRFVLDQNSYPTDELLRPELAQYQGPALLAYNSGVFSKNDFISLSRIGDSLKLDDESTTGRFGLGFNSVYNWTDSPSIVSGDQLKILDPHKRFSNGGPSWNFVTIGGSKSVQKKNQINNQMASFAKVIDSFDRPFDGTVIRIPLRNGSQAPHSEIVKKAVATSEVADVMRRFVSDFKTTGLLFMKNVERISVSVDDQEHIEIKISNIPEVRQQKAIVNSTIKELCRKNPGPKNLGTKNLSFEVHIETTWPSSAEMTKFCVHHLIGEYPKSEDLKNWSKSHSFLPWVAVATQLSPKSEEIGKGSFFTVLPLPIETKQPVHIQGFFSLSSDRTRLNWSSDSTVQDKLPARWNRWLLDDLVPAAWVNLLLFLSVRYPSQSAYGAWPRLLLDSTSGCFSSMDKVVKIIEKQNLALWHTGAGFVKSEDALFSSGYETLNMLTAINSVAIPIIQLPYDIRNALRGHCKALPLDARNLCGRLDNDHLRRATEETKQILLDYILSDASQFSGYGALELFPFEDGLFKSIKNAAFVHRNEQERTLFSRAKCHNIDLGKISSQTTTVLMQNLSGVSSLHPSLQHRSTGHFKDYCLNTVFKDFDKDEDIITLEKSTQEFVRRAWEWIAARRYSLDKHVSCVWLLPLSDGTYRKIIPQNTSKFTVCTPSGPIDDFLRGLAAIDVDSNRPIVLTDEMPSKSIELVVAATKGSPNLYIRIGSTLEGFVIWLNDIREVVECRPDVEKTQVQELLVSQFTGIPYRPAVKNALRELAIFQKLAWKDDPEMIPSVEWTSLADSCNNDTRMVGLLETIPVPELPNACFLDARSHAMPALLRGLRIECLSSLEVLAQFMIPFWERHLIENWSSVCKQHIAELLLKNYTHLESGYCSRIKSLSFVPVRLAEGQSVTKFLTAAELIHPSKKELLALFFDSEEVRPAQALFPKYEGILIQLGLKQDLDDDLVKSRVKCFKENNSELEITWRRACNLLQMNSSWAAGAKEDDMSILRQSFWLPVFGIDGEMILASADNCRSLDDQLLVGHVLPVLKFAISKGWKKLLGWNKPIGDSVLLLQLKMALEKKNRKVVNAIFTYIATNERIDTFSKLLTDIPCVLASTGDFVLARIAFYKGCSRLSPYLYDVNRYFWEEHKSLLEKIGVLGEPKLQTLLHVQYRFGLDTPLKKEDLKVLVELINLASCHPRSELSSLRILNDAGSLSAIDDVVYSDGSDKKYLLASTGEFVSTHPDLPLDTIRRLEIELLSEKMIRQEFSEAGIDDEDEFYQHEDVITGISDTLDRYRVESTFKEYLANADDTGEAHQVSWLLDERQHPRTSLLTQELRASQGPALLVHNDGVFKEKDFKGFKDVGRGSKRDDPTTIGKFGRGSQTMYHWTDVPMLLSGKYLLILDPLQEVLLKRDPRGPRIPGLKRPLSWFRKACPDQLAPFDGLWGYSRDMDDYRGTIFRFPLRSRTSESRMRCKSKPLDSRAVHEHMENFWNEARISLIFLKNVRRMDFKVHGEKELRWSVRSSRERVDCSLSDRVICTMTKRSGPIVSATAEDRWWVATQDQERHFAKVHYRHERTMKNVQCAMAALVSTKTSNLLVIPKGVPEPKFFSTLPLPFMSNLPVNIHATFLITGDRQSIPIEKSMQDAGAEFNGWLLRSAIPRLYLTFLEDLAGKMGLNAFRFWPQNIPAANTPEGLICTSFWDKFLTDQKLPNHLYKLFPPASRYSQTEVGKPPLSLDAKEAIFDFLPSKKSKILSDLLESLIPALARIPSHLSSMDGLDAVSVRVRNYVQLQAPKVNLVTSQMVRTILKSDEAAQYLGNHVSNTRELHECLFDLVKPADANEKELAELNGCRILPLADGGWGILRSLDSSKSTGPVRVYYVADDSEIELFNFASDLLVRREPGNAFKRELIDGKRFNLSRLSIDNVHVLLQRKNFGSNLPTKEMDAWLRKFWKIWREAGSTENAPLTIAAYPVFEVTHNRLRTYEKLDLESFPAVVEPSDKQHQLLCDKIPGIYKFNRNLMPAYLSRDESSLKKPSSFIRFVQTLGKLAGKEGSRLDDFVISHFSLEDLKIFRQLVIEFLSPPNSSRGLDIKYLLKLLPLFPTIDPSKPWVCAERLFVVKDKRLLVPWIRNYGRFVDPDFLLHSGDYQRLEQLIEGVTTAETLLVGWLLPSLPSDLNASNKGSYAGFINGILGIKNWTIHLHTLRSQKLAPDGDFQLRTTNSLFDHEDAVFASAFRLEKKKRFLLEDVRPARQFWLAMGLAQRADGQYEGKDYILCLKTIGQRIQDSLREVQDLTSVPDLLLDTEFVLHPLVHGFHAVAKLQRHHWALVQRVALFPALTALQGQPQYRQQAMAMQTFATPLLRLENAVRHVHMPVCWSQTPFPRYEPSLSTFDKIPSQGNPGTDIVWNHLIDMSELSQNLMADAVTSFLSDLMRTYEYLQDNVSESCLTFRCRDSRIWLNLDTIEPGRVNLQDLQSSWLCIDHLLLKASYDSPPSMFVREPLSTYGKLLRALDCPAIKHDAITLPDIPSGASKSSSLAQFRKEGKMLDVKLVSTEGKHIEAHQLVLATSSQFFERRFSGRWPLGEPVDLKNIPYAALSIIVEFSYTESLDWTPMMVHQHEETNTEIIADKLDSLLDLYAGASFLLMDALAAQAQRHILEQSQIFIRPENVRDVRDRAGDINAQTLKEACESFEKSNKKTVDLVYRRRGMAS